MGCFCAVTVLSAQPGLNDDPLPIVRIAIPPERVAKELEKVQQGTLALQPLDEFEARVKQARRLLANREQKPRLRGAHYRAEIVGHQMINGSGQWHIHHPVADPALLPIDPFSLALHKIKWEQGTDAACAEFDGKSLSLLVPGGQYRTCFFDWSMRGTLTPEGMQFALAVPACASCEFELLVPAEYWLSVPKSAVLVMGPIESESPAKRLWRIQASGLPQFTITLRRIADPGAIGIAATTLFSRSHSTQIVDPRRVSVDQEFQIDIVHGSVRELSLEADPRLQPFEVSFKGGQLKSWLWKDGVVALKDAKGKASKEAPGILTLQFDQPMHGKLDTLRIRSIAPAPSGDSWSSPAFRLANSFSRGETLTVRTHSILPTARWNTGSFDVTHIASDADGTQTITLVETATNAGASRRPTVLFHANSVDLTTDARCRWTLADSSAVYETELHCIASRGSSFEIRALLPKSNPAYDLEHVAVLPEGLMRGWYVTGETLVIELKQPLTPARDAKVSVRMRAKFAANVGTSRVLFHPDIDLTNATRRTGRLEVFVADSAHAQLVSSSLPQTPSTTDAGDASAPSYSFHWRNQRLTTAIRITPKPGQFAVRGDHRITLQSTYAPMRFRWEIEPLAGSPQYVDFRLAPTFPQEWRIGSEAGKSPIHHVEKMPLAEALPHLLAFGTAHPLARLAMHSSVPAGPVWRFHFAEPLRAKTQFSVETAIGPVKADRAAPASPARSNSMRLWDVPAMAPMGAGKERHEIAIESIDEVIHRIVGPSNAPSEAVIAKTPFGIRLRDMDSTLGYSKPWKVWTQSNPVSPASVATCDEAECLTKVYSDGRVYHQLSFRQSGYRLPTCELQLPEAVRVVAVRVQDRWLNHFRSQSHAGVLKLTLPCDDSATSTRYVIVAQSHAPLFLAPGMTRVALPRIGWPVEPIDVRMRLAVEEGVAPIFPDDRAAIGTPKGLNPNTAWLGRAQAAWRWGDSWLPWSSTSSSVGRTENTRRTALLAEARLNSERGETSELGALLERYALIELKEKLPLVIDRLAFKELGLEPRSPVDPKMHRAPIDRPFWETLGLVGVPTSNGLLLTTSSRMHQLGVASASHFESLVPAMREAILAGRDSSDGLYLITEWLNRALAGAEQPSLSVGWHGPDDSALLMREWDMPFVANGGTLLLLDMPVAHALGWLMALLWLFACYATRNRWSARTRVRAQIVLVAILVVVVAFAPPVMARSMLFPSVLSFAVGLIAAVVTAAKGYQIATTSDVIPSRPSTPAAGTVAATLLFAIITWQCYAQPSTPARSYTVWIIQNPKSAVLVPAELSARLDEIEKQTSFTSLPTVFLSARYVGQMVDNRARFEVDYEVLTLRPTMNFVIPISGVQLEEGSLLDGTPAFPAPNKNGYALAIRKPGVHHIRLAFTVPIDTTSGMQGVRFSAPKAPRCDLRIQWSAPVQNPQLARGSGEARIVAGSPNLVRGWHAQIGYENDIHFRWASGSTLPAAKGVEVSEAHYWDLRHGNLSLASQLHYRLGGFSLGQLAILMPEGLQVQGIEAHAIVFGGPLNLPITIKHWQVQGKSGQRRLLIDFAKPITGDLVLRMEALPTDFSPQRLMLSLPAPIQGKSTEGRLGYRLNAIESRGAAQNLAVQSMTTDEFQQVWQRLGDAKPVAPTRSYRFQRKAASAGLELFVQSHELRARCEFLWDIDTVGADLLASCTLSSAVGDVYFAEFQIDPGIVLAGVRGPDVNRWHLHESLLQVWLKQPKKQTTIEIVGWQTFAGKADKKGHASLPVHPLHAQLVDSAIELRPTAGLELDVVNQRSLRRIATSPHRFAITAWPWELAYQIRRQKGELVATTHAKIARDEQGFVWSQELRIRSDRGTLPPLVIKAANLSADGVKFDIPGGIVSALPVNKANETTWRIQFSDGLPAYNIVTISARLRNDGTAPSAPLSLPAVEIVGAKISRATVAWKDVDMIDERSGKLIAGIQLKIDKGPSEKGVGLSAPWKVASVRSAMAVVARPMPTEATVQAMAYSESISRTAFGDWMREASFWIRSTQPTDVRVRFPHPFEMLQVSIDGTLQPTASGDANNRTLTMKLNGAPQLVSMRWKYKAGIDKPNAPNTEPVQIAEVPLPTGGRDLVLPRGSDIHNRTPDAAATLLNSLLRETETVSRLLAESPALTPQIDADSLKRFADRQQRFFRLVRQAGYLNGIVPFANPNHDTSEVQERLNVMKNNNAGLAKRNGWDKLRGQYEKSVGQTSSAVSNFHSSRLGSPMAVHAGPSSITLVSQADADTRQRWTVIEVALLGALLLLVLSYFRQTYTLLRLAGPEVALVMIVAAIALLGFGVLPLALAMIPIGIRVAWTIQFARGRWFAAPQPTRSAEQASTQTLPPTVK